MKPGEGSLRGDAPGSRVVENSSSSLKSNANALGLRVGDLMDANSG